MTDKKEFTNFASDDDEGGPSAPPATDFPTAPPPAYTATEQVNNEFINPGYQATPPQQYTTTPTTTYASEQQGIYSAQSTYSAPAQQPIIVRQQQLPFTDHTSTAILVTFCCCLPFGIVGLIKANEAKNLLATGNYEAAGVSATSAGNWTKAGLIFGLVLYSFVAVTLILVVALGTGFS